MSPAISSRRLACAAALLFALVARAEGPNAPSSWRVDRSASRVTVHVFRAGLLSPALHDHYFQPENWNASLLIESVDPPRALLDVRIAADSLKDHQPKLSAKDTAKVEQQARGKDVLDAQTFPEVRFAGSDLELEPPAAAPGGEEFRGALRGNLTLRGRTRPLVLSIHGRLTAERLEANGSATFRQSDYGIRPFTKALGTISVKDEVQIEAVIVALRSPAPPSETPAASRRNPSGDERVSLLMSGFWTRTLDILAAAARAREGISPWDSGAAWPSSRRFERRPRTESVAPAAEPRRREIPVRLTAARRRSA